MSSPSPRLSAGQPTPSTTTTQTILTSLPPELQPVEPPVRTSDYRLALSNPFGYFLHRRLGLAHVLHSSEVLVIGGWAHKALEFDTFTPQYTGESQFADALSKVLLDKEEAAYSRLALSYEATQAILEQETLNAYKALAIYMMARETPSDAQFRGLVPFLAQPHMHVVARELRCEAVLFGAPVVGVIDLVVYNERTGYLWPIDFKTTAMKAQTRVESCTIEPQTLIYPRLLQENLHLLQCPGPVKGIGGFIHFVSEKPSIKMSGKDRDYVEEPHTLKSGPRKGQIEIRREYTGEPTFANYLARVREWFTASGEYIKERALIEASPRVEFSSVPWSAIQDHHNDAANIVFAINEWRTAFPEPRWFPKNPEAIFSHANLSTFAPFYLSPPSLWPRLMDEHGIVVRHREDQEHGEEDPQETND